MELLSVFGLILSVMLLCCGVVSVGKGMITNRVESVRIGAVCLLIGGLIVGGPIMVTSMMDSYVAQANAEQEQETVVLEDTVVYLGMRNETESGVTPVTGTAFSNGKPVVATGVVPTEHQELYLYFKYNDQEVKVEDIPELYFKCETLDYEDSLPCEVSVVEKDGEPDWETAEVVSIDGIEID